jgi:hypothetical protein
MSYLNNVRLVFSGQFQADVSTVNNDVRHFDNAGFQPSYQEFQQGSDWNGWWNPTGSGAFRFINCTVNAVCYGDGSSTDSTAQDPVIGLAVGGADDRTSGKIVDIDPQWQLASQLWGLRVRLVGEHGALFAGDYVPHAFRDLIFTRAIGLGGDRAASAYFQSVLRDISFADDAPQSRFLKELRAATQDNKLSIRLTTWGFQDDHTRSGFTVGTISGVIGPYLGGEPESFVLGRRFAPGFGSSSWNGINFFNGLLDGSGRLFLDLSNALPLDARYQLLDIGELTVGTLLNPNVPEGAPVGPGAFQAIGVIPYRDRGWLTASGGIATFTLTGRQLGNQPNPLAIVARNSADAVPLVAIRETMGGLYVGAEPFVMRIDAGNAATTTLYAATFGTPTAFAQVALNQTGEMPGLGGGPAALDPPVPIPVAGIPQGALSFPPAIATDANGIAQLTIATSPPDNPRGYIDGQLYNVNYQLAGQTRQAFGPFETIAIHLRDAYPVPERPTWRDDIAPIFVQYGNLYPIMSQRLVDLNDPAAVYAHRKLLALAFSLEISDPNYMPVTRDLSEGKRQTIVKWLNSLDRGVDPTFDATLQAPPPAAGERPALTSRAAAVVPAEAAEPAGSKTTFAHSLARARRARPTP